MLNSKLDNFMGMFAGQNAPYEIPPYVNNDIPPLSLPICFDSIMISTCQIFMQY